MYEDWPILDLIDVREESSLSFLSSGMGHCLAESLMQDFMNIIDNREKMEAFYSRIKTAEELSWIMRVITHSLSLTFKSNKQNETVRTAIRLYITWLSAVTDDRSIVLPTVLKQDPLHYVNRILVALKPIFVLCVDGEAVRLQIQEMRNVLRAVSSTILNCKEEYRESVWEVSLKFLFSICDSLLTDHCSSGLDDRCFNIDSEAVETLFNVFLRAVRTEYLPSPSYWKTLATICRRWRHQVCVVESWARKLLSLSILVVKDLYGFDSHVIDRIDPGVKEFEIFVGESTSEDSPYSVLFICWYQMLHLLGNPAEILDFNPIFQRNVPLNPIRALLSQGSEINLNDEPFIKNDGLEDLSPYCIGRIQHCFFLVCSALVKLVDILYGDINFPIDFKECESFLQLWSETISCDFYKDRHKQAASRNSTNSSNASDSSTLVAARVPLSTANTVGGSIAKGLMNSSTHSSKSRSASASKKIFCSERSAIAATSVSYGSTEDALTDAVKPISGQYVWYYLTRNKVRPHVIDTSHADVSLMLNIFMNWLLKSALIRQSQSFVPYDAISQKSVSSFGTEEVGVEGASSSGGEGNYTQNCDFAFTRRSFAEFSLASSGEMNAPSFPYLEIPSVDGVSAGCAAAVGALCKIVHSKTSQETLSDLQLAQFFKVVHESLIEKDRLVLCSLTYHGSNIFRLGLRGVEVLLPLFLNAVDIAQIESMKQKLHPSISEIEIRRSCLSVLSSVVCWPTVFGSCRIPDLTRFSNGGFMNASVLNKENSISYIELCSKIHRNLLQCLKHESDSINLHIALAMCNIICEETCYYESVIASGHFSRATNVEKISHTVSDSAKQCVSIIRSLISSISDNLCKPQWSSDLTICLAALDCLNSLSTIAHDFLFHNEDLSTGFLVLTSLCRFIETQLLKPPPLHSRDLHSSVVAAFSTLSIWLCAAPLLVETESCLHTIVQTIELGTTGGKNLPASQRKAASIRVNDAAENLLNILFSLVGRTEFCEIDERSLLYKYGPEIIDTTKFLHFLVKGQALLSIYEATSCKTLSNGRPSLFIVIRTPYHPARSVFTQLQSHDEGIGNDSIQFSNSNQEDDAHKAANSSKIRMTFSIPDDISKPACKLDAVIPPLKPTSDTDQIVIELNKIRDKMARGESQSRASDARNIWLREPLLSELSEPIRPQLPSEDCSVCRVLLYDLGLLSQDACDSGDIVMLDSARSDVFYRDLHEMVDRCPTKLVQTAFVFYVRRGQHSASEILENSISLDYTSEEFITLLMSLGNGIDVKTHAHWTGNWVTAYSANRKPVETDNSSADYVLDGKNHCLWWSDAHIEIAVLTPSIQCLHEPGNDNLAADTDQMIPEKYQDPYPTMRNRIQRAMTSDQENLYCKATQDASSAKSERAKSMSTVLGLEMEDRRNAACVKRNSDQRIFVIWLESYEDIHHFPKDDMLAYTCDGSSRFQPNLSIKADNISIFLNQIEKDLVRVRIFGDWTKSGLPGPLFDDCVVSNASLPVLLRQTIVSVTHRKTLELENYQLVSARRKRAIQEFTNKYAIKQSYAEMLENLLH